MKPVLYGCLLCDFNAKTAAAMRKHRESGCTPRSPVPASAPSTEPEARRLINELECSHGGIDAIRYVNAYAALLNALCRPSLIPGDNREKEPTSDSVWFTSPGNSTRRRPSWAQGAPEPSGDVPQRRPIPQAVVDAAREVAALLGGDPNSVHVQAVQVEPEPSSAPGGVETLIRDGDIADARRTADALAPQMPNTANLIRRLADALADAERQRDESGRMLDDAGAIYGQAEYGMQAEITRLAAELKAAEQERDRVTKVLRERIEVDAMLSRDFPIARDSQTIDDTGGA